MKEHRSADRDTEKEEVDPLDKEILTQCQEIREEIKDLRRRIEKLDKFLKKPPIVADTVTGSRSDLTIGPIKVSGIPDPLYRRREASRYRYKRLLETKEAELLELITRAEEYIESIPKSELRIMFRLYYIDGLTWVQVAHRMNSMFPKRRVKYTDDNLWRKNQRFFENVGSCREET